MESLATLLGPTATQSAVRCFAGATSAGLLTHKQLEKKEEQRRHPKPKNGVPVSPPTPEELEQQLQELHEGQVKAQELHRDLALLRQVVIPDLGGLPECLWQPALGGSGLGNMKCQGVAWEGFQGVGGAVCLPV
jgi:hypothetical protein